MRKAKLLFMVLIAAAAVGGVKGQRQQAQISGTVTDSSGGVMPGATVVLEDEQRGLTTTVQTSDVGIYVFMYLDSSTYRVTVEMPGFRKAVFPGLLLQMGEKKRLDATLEVGELSNAVEVKAAAAVLETDSATIGKVLSQREVLNIPLNGREFSQLALLMPGVRGSGYTGSALALNNATNLTMAGANSMKMDFQLDGVDNFYDLWAGPALNPSIDAIQEFRFEKSVSSAEYGRGGASIAVATKAGTNQFHGAAWDYVRNYKFNAGNYLTHVRDTLKRNQFGANLGGPIIRNKAFFFANWESQRQSSDVQSTTSVLTAKMRSGDLSELLAQNKIAKDPLTGQPFPNNVIPANRLDPSIQSYIDALYNLPNRPGLTNNRIAARKATLNWDQIMGRLDFQLTEKNKLFVRLAGQGRGGDRTLSSAMIYKDPPHEKESFYNLGVVFERSWSSTLLTQTRVGYHYEYILVPQATTLNSIKNPFYQLNDVKMSSVNVPVLNISDFTGIGYGAPYEFNQSGTEFMHDVSWFKGAHLVKAGGNFRLQDQNNKKALKQYVQMTFSTVANVWSGLGVSNLLLGLPETASIFVGRPFLYNRRKDGYVYVQDDWKFRSNLTLNLGLRYEIQGRTYEKYNRWGMYDIGSDKIVLAGDHLVVDSVQDPWLYNTYKDKLIFASELSGRPYNTLVNGDHNNFSPRVGFAWQPFKSGRVVVRGGYGIFYTFTDHNYASQPNGAVPYSSGYISTSRSLNPSITALKAFGGSLSAPLLSPYYQDPISGDSYEQQSHLGVQVKLPSQMVAEVSVQDNFWLKAEASRAINTARPGPGTVASRLPYPNWSSAMSGLLRDHRIRYDAMEMSVKKNTEHLNFQWSHTIAKNRVRMGPYIWDMDSWTGNQEPPHENKMHFVADLPFGKGRHWMADAPGVLDAVLGGWTVTGIATIYRSGTPLTVAYSGDTMNVGVTSVRAKRIGDGRLSNPTADQWFDTKAFAAPATGTFGDAGTGIFLGPAYRGADGGLYKSFSIREGMRVQFRSEFYNLFNHPILNNPVTTLNALNFGKITGKSLSPRTIQFALRLTF